MSAFRTDRKSRGVFGDRKDRAARIPGFAWRIAAGRHVVHAGQGRGRWPRQLGRDGGAARDVGGLDLLSRVRAAGCQGVGRVPVDGDPPAARHVHHPRHDPGGVRRGDRQHIGDPDAQPLRTRPMSVWGWLVAWTALGSKPRSPNARYV